MIWYLVPVFILAAVLLLGGLMVFLGRFRRGRYLRPVISTLSRVPWIRKQFRKASQATIERQNPELARAMRKLERIGPNPTPQQAQQALSQLSVGERRAYLDAVGEQGAMPEPANRQQRRLQQRLQQGTQRPASPSRRSGRRR